jgi:hypothetical protein
MCKRFTANHEFPMNALRPQAFALALLTGAFGTPTAGAGLSEGRPFPRITLPSADGRRMCSVNDFSGSKTMLHIFAAW